MIPSSFIVADKIGGCLSKCLLRGLFDSVSSKTLIHRSALSAGVRLERIGQPENMSTLTGNFSVVHKVDLHLLWLPEFDVSRTIVDHEAYLFDAPCCYQMILGIDFLRKTGIDIKCSEDMVEWSSNTVPFRDPTTFLQEDGEVCLVYWRMDKEDEDLKDYISTVTILWIPS